MAQKKSLSRRSRAARRATSPSINTDKSLKNVSLPISPSASPSSSRPAAASAAASRPSVLAAHHSAGVTKKTKRKSQVSAKARKRQEKGLEMAEAVLERTSKKVEKSLGRARLVQARRKAWDDINKAVAKGTGEAQKGAGEDEGEETDEDMGAGGDDDDGNAGGFNPAAPQPAKTTALPTIDDDDEIL